MRAHLHEAIARVRDSRTIFHAARTISRDEGKPTSRECQFFCVQGFWSLFQ